MLDLIIRGGEVVTPQDLGDHDIAVKGEKIASVAAPNTLSDGDAKRNVDVSGKMIMRGGIDPHTNMHHPWIKPDGETMTTAGPDQAGKAALHGGTTTLIDFAYWREQQTALEAIEARQKDFKEQSYRDYAYYIILQSEPQHICTAQFADAIEVGHPTLKIFTTNLLSGRTGRMIQLGDIWEALKVLAEEGGFGVIHAEDYDIVIHMYDKRIREGRVGFEHLNDAHNAISEKLSARRILRLAVNVPGTTLYMTHVSAATSVKAISEARAKGLPVYGETRHRYMLYTAEDYKRPNGQIYHTYPSMKSVEDQEALWAGALTGGIDCVVTDDLCCTLKEKTLGNRIDYTTGGNSSVEPRLADMYTKMVNRRGYSLRQYVDLVSMNVAKVMGLYPRKGAIAAGSDADITVLDPGRRGKVTAFELNETDYTPWEGHDILAWPELTILRGKIVVEDKSCPGDKNDGQLLTCKVPADILSGPAL